MENSRRYSFIAIAILLTIVFPLFLDSQWQGSKQLHTIMEVIATMLASFVGILALIHFHTNKDNQTFLFIGVGFIGTAFLDGYHAIVTSIFFDTLYPSVPSSLIPWSWIASRLFLAAFLFWSYYSFQYQKKIKYNIQNVYLYTSILTFTTFIFFAFIPLPRAYYPELFFHRPEELLPAVFFALALWGYYKKGGWKTDSFEYWLVISLIVSLISQLVFMTFSHHLFDVKFDIAHLLKKISYICVLTGLFISLFNLYTRVKNQAQELIKQRSILQQQSKMASMGEMIGAIAHQWRQPLSVVSISIQNLIYQYKAGEINEDFLNKYIEKNTKTIEFMSKTIDDFRSFFRVDKEKSKFKLKQSIENILNIQTAQLKHHNISITIDGEEIMILGYNNEFQQVILNLINNAKDILIENQVQNPIINIVIKNKIVTIRDNAGGIADDILERIFEPYFTTKEPGKGTGIGLYMSKMIIEENMGGILSARNVNGGAMFTINFDG